MNPVESPLRSQVSRADFFARVGYSTVWEDERVIDEALEPRASETALSITSGGDLSLQLALTCERVVSLDFNPRQTWLLELKRAAVLTLDHDQLWELVGLAPSAHRRQLYERARELLSEDARRYWDERPGEVDAGVLRCGKQDRYLQWIGRVLTLLQRPGTIREYFAIRQIDEQQRFFDDRWNGRLWRFLGAVLFGRTFLDFFFHKDHFRYARQDQHPGPAMRAQADRTLRDVPVWSNFYLHWLFFGTYRDRESCPAWLRESQFDRLKLRLARLEIHTAELEQFIFGLPASSVDVFNFSNIFDWVSQETFTGLMREVIRVARPGARLCYWTNVVNTRRELGSCGFPELEERAGLGQTLHRESRTPGYSSCTVGRVRKPA
ncbi:MAG: DUF3419 family protein [Candidatus Riflebacteria bacterium]|nr:DUF3419 family protein [Candidatus Riflebacteria bacterium]